MKNEDNYLLYIILVVLIILILYKMSKEHNEGFKNNSNNTNNNNTNNKTNNNINNNNKSNNTNNKYIKFNETVIDKEGINESIAWKNKSLSQCKFECNEDDKCVGFSREKIDDNKKGKCFPKENIGDCHSLRRGEPIQRDYASGFDSYIKDNYNDNNLLIKCIGDDHTLNRKIHISSYMDPDTYISIFNNDIRGIFYKDKNAEFQMKCLFEIVAGLEGTGTISFIMVDNFQENYYLSANIDTNTLVLIPIDKEKSSVKERSFASFELLDGFADSTKISIRTFSTIGEHYFWTFEGMETKEIKAIKNPTIKLVRKNMLTDRVRKEGATFNISDKGIKSKEEFISEPFIHHNNQELFSKYNKLHNLGQSNEAFNNTRSNKENNTFKKALKNLPNSLKEKYFTKEDFQSKKQTSKYSESTNAVILIDKEGNKLMIPSNINNISAIDLNNMVSKLNKIYTRDCPPSRFNKSEVVDLSINNTNVFTTVEPLLDEDIRELNTIFKNNAKMGFLDEDKILSILNDKFDPIKYKIKDIINILSKLYIKNCNPKKFNIYEINNVLITNPKEVSCRLYNYDYTIPGEFGDDNTLYEYENIINNTDMGMKEDIDYDMGELVYMAQSLDIDTSNKTREQLYENIVVKSAYKEGIELENGRSYLNKPDRTYLNKLLKNLKNKKDFNIDDNKFEQYIRVISTNITEEKKNIILEKIREYEIIELINKINKEKYFQIKSIQIFNHNPKDNFKKKTHKYRNTDYVSEKLRNLEKENVNDTTKDTFSKFNKNKKMELDAYRKTVFDTEIKLNKKRNNLSKDIEYLENLSANYKLDKLSKDNFFMKKRL